jgi:NAD(P)H-hydrate epimerase
LKVVTGIQARQIDAAQISDYEYPSILLMETAGRKAAMCIRQWFPQQPVTWVLCGNGNNGGDGLVIARYLLQFGWQVNILIIGPPEKLSSDAFVNYQILALKGIKYYQWDPANPPQIDSEALIIDALSGIGLQGALHAPVNEVVEYFRQLNNAAVAIDLPSGLLADTGKIVTEPIKCKYTITFQLPKYCHYIWPAAGYCGKVKIVDIGIYPEIIDHQAVSAQLLTKKLVKQWLPAQRPANSHKGNYGHVLVIGGSSGMAGAVTLSAMAVMRAGAGLCTVMLPAPIQQAVWASCPEAIQIPIGNLHDTTLLLPDTKTIERAFAGKHVCAVGMGMSETAETTALLEVILKSATFPLVLDADALNIMAHNPTFFDYLRPDIILTPHPGEMAKMLQTTVESVQQARLETVRAAAQQWGCIVVLKGANTLIANPEGHVFINTTGSAGMATAGSGDILSGMIAALIGQGLAPMYAAAAGVYWHGLAGQKAQSYYGAHGVTASRILKCI